MDAIIKDGVIKTAIFSLCMRGYEGEQSSIDFGSPEPLKMMGNSTLGIRSFRMNDDFFWSTYIQGVGLGVDPQTQSFSFDSNRTYTIFDNGASYIFLPPSVYPKLLTAILIAFGNPNSVVKNGYVLIDGIQAKPVPISFMFDNYWIMLEPEDILIDVS